MSTPVIKAEGLGKEYLIGARESGRETFREMLTSSFAAPFRRFRRLAGEAAPEERIWALKDVSFEVGEGEVVGIIGRNGAGKSTLLKILSRITEPTEGRALIRGRVASLLEVGTGFHPELTGRENIRLNGAILGMTRAEIDRKFDEIVAFAEVEKFLDTPVKRYSSGMAVRLAFAVAAHLDPEILLVDEVLAVGDAAFQKKCLGTMTKIAATGRTILFVSHNLNAIKQFCPRAIFLDEGTLIKYGESGEIIGEYLNAYGAIGKHGMSSKDLSQTHRYLRHAVVGGFTDGGGASIPYDQSLLISVSYEAPAASTFRVGVAVNDQFGNFLFHSWDTDSLNLGEACAGNSYNESCIIPPCFLRPGKYTAIVEMRIEAHRTIQFREMAELVFEVSELGFSDRWGLIAPRLEWEQKNASG